jgi:uncharacterized phage infection (PIP) family protein YhgE
MNPDNKIISDAVDQASTQAPHFWDIGAGWLEALVGGLATFLTWLGMKKKAAKEKQTREYENEPITRKEFETARTNDKHDYERLERIFNNAVDKVLAGSKEIHDLATEMREENSNNAREQREFLERMRTDSETSSRASHEVAIDAKSIADQLEGRVQALEKAS